MKIKRPALDPHYMRMAIELAAKARPNPNPQVGAVVVKDGEVLGVGYHERAGLPHAEVVALQEAGRRAEGADLYVTLEPCCHQGRTGPCSSAIAAAGIARVAVGMVDPDEKVAGDGIETLHKLGVLVETGIEREKCEELLAAYTVHRTRGRPRVTLKAAITMDGCLATQGGDSKWISSPASRTIAHQMRAASDAVLVGIGTVIADDPLLNVRHTTGPNPTRVAMDSHLRLPLDSGLVATAREIPLIVAYTDDPDRRFNELNQIEGVTLLKCGANSAGQVDPLQLATLLAEQGVMSLLVEGGSRIHGAFLACELVDEVVLFMAPKIFGGGISWAQFSGTQKVEESVVLSELHGTKVGGDLIIKAKYNAQ